MKLHKLIDELSGVGDGIVKTMSSIPAQHVLLRAQTKACIQHMIHVFTFILS